MLKVHSRKSTKKLEMILGDWSWRRNGQGDGDLQSAYLLSRQEGHMSSQEAHA